MNRAAVGRWDCSSSSFDKMNARLALKSYIKVYFHGNTARLEQYLALTRQSV